MAMLYNIEKQKSMRFLLKFLPFVTEIGAYTPWGELIGVTGADIVLGFLDKALANLKLVCCWCHFQVWFIVLDLLVS